MTITIVMMVSLLMTITMVMVVSMMREQFCAEFTPDRICLTSACSDVQTTLLLQFLLGMPDLKKGHVLKVTDTGHF